MADKITNVSRAPNAMFTSSKILSRNDKHITKEMLSTICGAVVDFWNQNQGSNWPIILGSLVLQTFLNLEASESNTTSDWLNQSEIVLLSPFTKSWRERQRTMMGIVVEYGLGPQRTLHLIMALHAQCTVRWEDGIWKITTLWSRVCLWNTNAPETIFFFFFFRKNVTLIFDTDLGKWHCRW